MRHQRILLFISLFVSFSALAQLTITYQGGEPGDPWTYTSSGASAIALSEALNAPNKTSGTQSLVAGGNTGGGSCFAGGSGNGPSVARSFSFDEMDISQTNEFPRTLTFNWGNRFPACNGTGWDSGENLTFTAYHDGVQQPVVTLATGSGNAQFSILTHQHTHTIPACVNSFRFVVSVTTNRADELLFIDDVTLTAPQLNGSAAQPSAVSGPVSVCIGAMETYSVQQVAGTNYTWSGLPSGAQFTSPNGTTTAHNITIDWGSAAPGTYTLVVTPSNSCGAIGIPQTVNVTVEPAPDPVIITGTSELCAGQAGQLECNYTDGIMWSTGENIPVIDITVPGTYSVGVLTACGTISAQFVVAAGEIPQIQSLDIEAITCSGLEDGGITVQASGNNSPFLYAVNGGDWQSDPHFSPLSPGTYTIAVLSGNGCQAEQAVVIEDAPAINIAAYNDGPVCSGSAAGLHVVTDASGNAVYQWQGPNGYSSTISDPADATDPGVYSVVITVGSCTAGPAETTVETLPVPVVVVTDNSPVCAGNPIALNASVNIAGNTSYQWSGPGGFTSLEQSPSGATTGGIYTVTATTDGCPSAAVQTDITVNPVPDAQATYNAPYCPGNQLMLYGSTSSPGNVVYQWSGPNGYTSAEQNPADAVETGAYTLFTEVNGCQSTAAVIHVLAEPPSLQLSSTGPACEGTAVELTGISSAGGAAVYSWTGPNGFTSAQPSVGGITAPGTYSLTVTAGSCMVSEEIDVVIFPLPVAAFQAENVCSGTEMGFVSQSFTPGVPNSVVSWQWIFGDGLSGTGEQTMHTYANAGTYVAGLEVTNGFGCSAYMEKTVTVYPVPQAAFSVNPEQISELDPFVQITNVSLGGDSFSWLIDSTWMTVYEPGEYHVNSSAGKLDIMLVAANTSGCADTMWRTVPIVSDIVSYVPNAFTPDGDEYNNTFLPVLSGAFDPYHYSLMIYNRWGELLFETKDPAVGWDGSYAGQIAEHGTYIWAIAIKHRDTDEKKLLSGHVSLIR